MRSRALKHGNKGGEMEIEKLNNKLKDQEQPHLSGAYIRSLVKQLSSSRTKNSPMNQKALDTIDGHGVTQKITKCSSDGLSENQKIHQPQQPEQPKKQVRRRLHTSRPYQERLLNMAEARREIVTALKFHRASMKQANEQQQQQQQLQSQSQSSLQPSPHPPLPQLFQEQEENRNSRRKYQTSTTTNTISCCYENPSYSPFSCPPPPSCSFPWGASSIEPIPFAENFNLPLPNQPLGLNLSFNDFNLDTTLYHYNNENPSIYSYSSQTSSSNHTLSSPEEEAHSIMVVPEEPQHHIMANGGGVHTAFGSYDMADIQSSGEQHQMEYNDTMNIVDSAWWVEFDSTMEKKEEKCDEDDEFHIFDEVMEFPAWMNDDENCLLDEHLENNCLDDDLQEPALPCMGIEEIDGMGGDWLA
ncbi:hypothetical protein IFM89_021631 [Coptis chinensis]|uniref:Hydroxyproline-rich glycoprotein family protein n=1 Tax=Coptis chinensis TaxID=261450 RepID=A0A835IBN7_9MAGN|nr:hypothetical protein IFM89_021631 [Coptis chinensis]